MHVNCYVTVRTMTTVDAPRARPYKTSLISSTDDVPENSISIYISPLIFLHLDAMQLEQLEPGRGYGLVCYV